jgi:two-component system chemotaxis sensor kinase CheA
VLQPQRDVEDLEVRGRRVPEVALADVLGLPSEVSDEERTLVVLRPAGGDVYALAVDRIHDHEELVVKPAAPAVMATGLYAGTTLADDGSPILLFDPAGLAQVGGVRLETLERGGRAIDHSIAANSNEVPVLLFRGLDGERRALRLGVVDRIEEVVASEAIRRSAGQLRVQLGETILPLAGVDKPKKLEGKVRIFRLNDGQNELGYAFREVIDMMTLEKDVIPADTVGDVGGVALIGGEPAELIDTHWIFSQYLSTSAARPGGQLVCRLPEGDAWMQNMLRPIVEAAGYLVIGEKDELSADVTIISQGRDVPEGEGGRVLRLASDPDAADGQDSIYRYDRAGLLIALKSASAGRR